MPTASYGIALASAAKTLADYLFGLGWCNFLFASLLEAFYEVVDHLGRHLNSTLMGCLRQLDVHLVISVYIANQLNHLAIEAIEIQRLCT